MSAAMEKTPEEWVELCASQERTIKKLTKDNRAYEDHAKKMKKTVSGINDLMDEQTHDHEQQMVAARALIASLKVFKAQCETDGVKMSNEVALADTQEKRFETINAAVKAKGPY